jgi:hypothetical protein
MKNKSFLVGMTSLMSVFWLTLMACPIDDTNREVEKVKSKEIVLTGISGIEVTNTYVWSPGTITQVASGNQTSIDGSTVVVPLFSSGNDRWTGTGTFDVGIVLDGKPYKKENVLIDATATSIPFIQFEPARILIIDDVVGTTITSLGVFPTGADIGSSSPVAAASNVIVSSSTGILLYIPNGSWWTGTGLHDVYVRIDGTLKKKTGVNFSTSPVTVSYGELVNHP